MRLWTNAKTPFDGLRVSGRSPFRSIPPPLRLSSSKRGFVLLTGVLLLAACTPPVKQYALRNQPLSCADANRTAYRAVQSMRFTVTSFEPAASGRRGVIKATRTAFDDSTQKVRVLIDCAASGASVDIEEEGALFGQIELKRPFYQSFTNIVSMDAARADMDARIDAGTAPASQQRRDLQVLVEPVRGQAAKLDFDIDLAAAGVLPVRITIKNHTAQAYRLQPADIRLTGADRTRVAALSAAAAAQRVAATRLPDGTTPSTALPQTAVNERLRGALFNAEAVAPGAEASGYLFFPLAEYRSARVTLIEAESEESEGFLVEF